MGILVGRSWKTYLRGTCFPKSSRGIFTILSIIIQRRGEGRRCRRGGGGGEGQSGERRRGRGGGGGSTYSLYCHNVSLSL